MLIIAILQILFGVGFGFMNSQAIDQEAKRWAHADAAETLRVGDRTMTVGELLAFNEKQRVQGFVVPIGVGVAFVLLWVWAKRAALPAMVCALLLFLTVHGIDAAVDPTHLANGIIVKAFFIVALIGGIKSAVQQRVEERVAST